MEINAFLCSCVYAKRFNFILFYVKRYKVITAIATMSFVAILGEKKIVKIKFPSFSF